MQQSKQKRHCCWVWLFSSPPLLPVLSFWLHLLGSCPQPQRRAERAPCHDPWPPKDEAPTLTVHPEVGVCPPHCRGAGKPTGHPQPSGKKVNFMSPSGADWAFLSAVDGLGLLLVCFGQNSLPKGEERKAEHSPSGIQSTPAEPPMESYKQKANFTECHLENQKYKA